MKKWLLIVIAVFVASFGYSSNSRAGWDYWLEDVPIDSSHYSNIHYLADLGVIKGYPVEGYDWIVQFKPSNEVTKRQVATMLVRALELEQETYKDPGFSDVKKTDGAYKEIAIATQRGFFKKGDKFNPGTSITRAEMAYALVAAFKLQGQSKLVFSDVPTTHAAYKDVQALAANKITTGSNGKFHPDDKLTRAQFASFLARAILPEARSNEEGLTFGFVPEAEGKIYKYKLYHGGSYEELVYDKIRFASYQGFNRSLLLSNSANELIEMGYFENSQAVQFDVPIDGYSRLFVLEYPLKSNTTFTFNEVSDDDPTRKLVHKVDVYTTNGIYKVNGQIYTNVTIAKDQFDVHYESGTTSYERIFYIAQDYGIIAADFPDAGLELDRIEQ